MKLKKVCCMSLHTAGLFVGWLGIILAFIAITISALTMRFTDYDDKFLSINGEVLSENIVNCIYLGSFIISGLTSGLLVLGTIKNRDLMLLPWLILYGMGIPLNILSLINAAFAMLVGPIEHTFRFFILALYAAFYHYIYLGIYSLYKHMEKSKDADHEIVRPVSEPVHRNTQPTTFNRPIPLR